MIPEPESTTLSVGSPAAPWDTRYTLPVSGAVSTGVEAVLVPTTDAGGQLAGFALNVAARHACWTVLNRAESPFGKVMPTDRRFAPPAGCVTVTLRLAPLFAEVEPLVEAVIAGVKGSCRIRWR